MAGVGAAALNGNNNVFPRPPPLLLLNQHAVTRSDIYHRPFTALASLIIFSIQAGVMNGDTFKSGTTFNEDADCGFNNNFNDMTGGASFGLAIVSFILALGQAGAFFMANKADA
jgi:hypothetical protein